MAEILEIEVKSNIGAVTKDVNKATTATEELAKAEKNTGNAAKSASLGVGIFGRALKGIAVTLSGLGIITIVAGAFTALKEAMTKNQAIMDTISDVTTTISTTFNQLVNILIDTFYYVTQGSKNFSAFGTVLDNLKTIALAPLSLAFDALKLSMQAIILAYYEVKDAIGKNPLAFTIGKDGKLVDLNETSEAAKAVKRIKEDMKETKSEMADTLNGVKDAGLGIVDNFGAAIDEVTEVYTRASGQLSEISVSANFEQAKATTKAAKDALFADVTFKKLNAEKLKEAELLRQIRDDENETFAARIKANKELKISLEEQQKLQSAQIAKQVRAAELAVKNIANDENKLALMEAINLQLELEETITGQLSEQKTNAVGLEKELLETQRTLRAENLSGTESELEELQNAYDIKVEMARKAGEDITGITANFEDEKLRIKEAAADKEEAIDKAVKDAKVGMAQSGLQLISAIAGEGTALAKTAAVAQATISGVEGVQNAFTTAQKSPLTALMPAYPFIQAGLAGAFSAVQIQKILSGSPADGSDGGGGGGAVPSTPAPQMMSGNFNISGGVAPEPIKAFVLTDEMSNSQNQLANIRRRATI